MTTGGSRMGYFNKLQNYHLVRYLIVGGAAFGTEYGSFFLLYEHLKTQLYVANSLSFCIGLSLSFTFNRMWAFKATEFKRRGQHQFVLYAALALINLFLTNVIIGILNNAGINPLAGKIVAMLTIVAWNFFIFKFIIFEGQRPAA